VDQILPPHGDILWSDGDLWKRYGDMQVREEFRGRVEERERKRKRLLQLHREKMAVVTAEKRREEEKQEAERQKTILREKLRREREEKARRKAEAGSDWDSEEDGDAPADAAEIDKKRGELADIHEQNEEKLASGAMRDIKQQEKNAAEQADD
jgi:hypothetical protein